MKSEDGFTNRPSGQLPGRLIAGASRLHPSRERAAPAEFSSSRRPRWRGSTKGRERARVVVTAVRTGGNRGLAHTSHTRATGPGGACRACVTTPSAVGPGSRRAARARRLRCPSPPPRRCRLPQPRLPRPRLPPHRRRLLPPPRRHRTRPHRPGPPSCHGPTRRTARWQLARQSEAARQQSDERRDEREMVGSLDASRMQATVGLDGAAATETFAGSSGTSVAPRCVWLQGSNGRLAAETEAQSCLTAK